MENSYPKHIGVILDGNRRYAKARNLPTFKGHTDGADKVENFLRWCRELKIKEVTMYALSTENLKRTEEELNHLFYLVKKFFNKVKKDKEIHEKKLKIKFIGDLNLVPKEIKELVLELEEDTKNYDNFIVNFCFAYGGRLELLNAFNKLKNSKKEITENDITNALWLSSEPDFIIRTGGTNRTSNFLPWQSVYSEWFFLDKMWPEIEKNDLIKCVEDFKNTKRNFGK